MAEWVGAMELYILRHGIAEDTSSTGRDEDRELTPDGRKKLRDIMKFAAEVSVNPSLILTSPLVRAVQTAQIASEELGYKDELVRSNALKPDVDPQMTWEEIRAHRAEQQVLLASHNPLCARLAGHLLACPNLQIDFKKGGLLRIDFDQFGAQSRGVLKWMLIPKLTG